LSESTPTPPAGAPAGGSRSLPRGNRPLPSARRRTLRTLTVLLAVALAGGGYWAWDETRARAEWRAAEEAARRRDFASASAHFERYAELRPGEPGAWLRAARAARRRGRFPEATRLLTECEKRGGETDATRLERTLMLVQQGHLGEADVRLRATVGPDHPDAALVLEALARGYLTAERWGDARQACELWLALEPDHPWPWLWSGWVAERLGERDRAAECFRRALERDPDDPAVRTSVARSLVRRRDPAAAVPHLEWVLARSPGDAEAILGLAECRIEEGRAVEAAAILEPLLKADPPPVRALALRGKAAAEGGDQTGAERWLRQALAREPDDAPSLHLLVQSLRAQRRDAEADALGRRLEDLQRDLRRLTELLQLIGTLRAGADAYQEAGVLSLRVGRARQGVNLLREALRRGADRRAAHGALADHYRRAGEPGLADYHQALAGTAGHAPPAP
jgi:tetratricopeptide (TPR) repeat protein